jgi:DNA-binding response OmpR family regulator
MDESRPILLIEDDPDAVELMRLAFKKEGLRRPLRILRDGDEAIAYLSNVPPYENPQENPPPCLLVLDVKLPRKSGLEVLTWLRSYSSTRPLPVIMLTSSNSSKDIDAALRLGIQSYCVKPTDFNDLKKLALMIRRRVEETDEDPGEESVDERPVAHSHKSAGRGHP